MTGARSVRALSSLVLLLVALLALPAPAEALKRRDGEGGPTIVCPIDPIVSATLTHGDLPLLGMKISVTASPGTVAVAEASGDDCDFTIRALPSHSWSLTRPAGSSASLAGTSGLTVDFTPDVAGTYQVVLTACPGGCSISLPSGSSVSAAEQKERLTIVVEEGIAPPPETEPLVPDQPAAAPASIDNDGCGLRSDLTEPAWRAIEVWNGSGDYRLLAGRVTTSQVSRVDNFLNHDTHDHNAHVEPYPSFFDLKNASQEKMEIEWESGSYAERFWPTRFDRLAAVGYWIKDCAHDARSEIHPPAFTAAQRPRAVAIPASLGLGSDVWVPGIVTDIFVSRHAGEATNCSQTGLHQPSSVGFLNECLPRSVFSEDLNPIQTVFTFDIHLPRDPQEIIAPVKPGPPVPLFFAVENPEGSPGPDPVVVQDPTHPNVLNVTLDLRTFTAARVYSRRIVAAWAYPSPDNWGLREWKVRFESLDVHDDGDGRLRGDGDWRFWINVNNGDREWLKIFDCSGCVHGHEDFDGRAFETDSPHADRRFGPDLKLFPGQKVLVHSGGYEEDWMWDDATGYVTRALDQRVGGHRLPSFCRSSTKSGCASYSLNVEVSGGDPVLPELTPAGEDLHDGYVVTAEDLDDGAATMPPIRPTMNLPTAVVLAPDQEQAVYPSTDFFPVQRGEPNSLANIDDEAFASLIAELEAEEALAPFLTAVREEADEALASRLADEALVSLGILRANLPEQHWQAYFGDIEGVAELE